MLKALKKLEKSNCFFIYIKKKSDKNYENKNDKEQNKKEKNIFV